MADNSLPQEEKKESQEIEAVSAEVKIDAVEEPGKTLEASPKYVSLGLAVVLALCLSVMSSVGVTIAYDHFMAQKLVCVDMKGFLSDQRDLFLAGKITEDQFSESLDQLDVTLKGLPRNKAVLMADSVLRGVPVVEVGASKKEKKAQKPSGKD